MIVKGDKLMRYSLIVLTVVFLFVGATAIFGKLGEEMINIMYERGTVTEQLLWESTNLNRGIICVGFAITWLVVIPWHQNISKRKIVAKLYDGPERRKADRRGSAGSTGRRDIDEPVERRRE
jgi:hypothetical protein